MRFHSFRSFRGRLVAVFVGLFAVILATCFLVVAAAVRASARHEIGEELRLAGTLFVRQLESRSQQLVAATRLLSGDFALKTAAATADQETTRSVLANHRQRIEADVLMLVSPEGSIAADTRQLGRLGAAFPLSRLLEDAIYVVTTPYFAKTAAAGKARLDGLTPGYLRGARLAAADARRHREDSAAGHPCRRRAGTGGVRRVAQGGVARAAGARLLQGSTGKLAFRKWWLKKALSTSV